MRKTIEKMNELTVEVNEDRSQVADDADWSNYPLWDSFQPIERDR